MSSNSGHRNADSDIQIISETGFQENRISRQSTVICAFCTQNLDGLDLPGRSEHYEEHLRNVPQGLGQPNALSKIFKSSTSSTQNRKTRQWEPKRWFKKDDVFWYRAHSTPPPSNYTPGLVLLLKKVLWKCHAQGTTRRAALCYEGSVHISHRFWDSGWGCGYRNFLMVCTALMDQSLQPLYFPLLDDPIPPGIRNLQVWIEDAWKAGFDETGAKDLKCLVGTKKWIGTADLWVAFSSRGIPVELVDFNLKNQTRGVDIILDWIIDYFSPKPTPIKEPNVHDALRDASPIVVTDRMPLILQYDGHSRTIVGYEISKTGKVNLLMFDPSIVVDKQIRNAVLSTQPAPSHEHVSQHMPSFETMGKARKRVSSNLSFPAYCGTKRTRPSPDSINKAGENGIATSSHVLQQNGVSFKKTLLKEVGAGLSSQQVMSRFRLDRKKLSKKEYQILYFPMTSPLDEMERKQRQSVTSTKIC